MRIINRLNAEPNQGEGEAVAFWVPAAGFRNDTLALPDDRVGGTRSPGDRSHFAESPRRVVVRLERTADVLTWSPTLRGALSPRPDSVLEDAIDAIALDIAQTWVLVTL